MTITRKTTFLRRKALMPELNDSRGKKKILALLCRAGYSKTFPFCVFKLFFFSCINMSSITWSFLTETGSQASLCQHSPVPPTQRTSPQKIPDLFQREQDASRMNEKFLRVSSSLSVLSNPSNPLALH